MEDGIVSINWEKIQKLRKHYLGLGDHGSRDYWDDIELIETYDEILGARIAWKWDAVLNRLKEVLKFEEKVTVFDWGCGTAVASRKFCESFGDRVSAVSLFDRSTMVASFGKKKLLQQEPQLKVELLAGMEPIKSTFALLSHVINEVAADERKLLVNQLRGHEVIIWLEPGTYKESRNLIEVREQLLDDYEVIAPCPDQASCPMSLSQHSKHWCHFFAQPPNHVFHSPFWKEVSKQLAIDTRSLPTSFLCLKLKKKTMVGPKLSHYPLHHEAVVIGRPRIYKGYLKYLECKKAGLADIRLQKRDDKVFFKRLSGGGFWQTLSEKDTLLS
jgi:hypothetical protein